MPDKQDEGLLLTPEEIEEAIRKACRRCKAQSPSKYVECCASSCFETDRAITQAQLAKARPIIEARKDAEFKAKMVPSEVLEETIQVRVREAVKQERERIGKELYAIVLETPSSKDRIEEFEDYAFRMGVAIGILQKGQKLDRSALKQALKGAPDED